MVVRVVTDAWTPRLEALCKMATADGATFFGTVALSVRTPTALRELARLRQAGFSSLRVVGPGQAAPGVPADARSWTAVLRVGEKILTG